MPEAHPPSSKPPCSRDDALAVLKHLRGAGHVAYFAGGCVRDELLGIQPKDYDIATEAPPQRVRELFSNTQAVGAAFGVILVRHGRSVVEVATFRSDDVYLDGRRPSKVRFTTAEEDAKRRDFTINGLFFDPIESKVIDYVGGQKDLAEGVLRAIGDANERFAEDYLRVLRAIRFATRFGLRIEPATEGAIIRHASRVVQISPERIADELRMMLTPSSRVLAWELIRKYRLHDVIFRFLRPERAEVQPEGMTHRKLDIFDRVCPGESIPFGLSLASAALEYTQLAEWPDLGVRRMVRALRQSLRISNDEAELIKGTLHGTELLLRDEMPGIAALKRFLAQPAASHSRALVRVVGPLIGAGDQVSRVESQLRVLEQSDFAPPPLLSGDDLVAAGWTPGPVFKRVLDQVYDAQLEDRITTKQQALELAEHLRNQSK